MLIFSVKMVIVHVELPLKDELTEKNTYLKKDQKNDFT